MYKSTDVIFVKTDKRGFIPHLRISGPIVSPMRVSIGQCVAMLTANIPLYQFDTVTKKLIKLSLENLMDDTKFVVKEVKPIPSIPPIPPKSPELPKFDLKINTKVAETPVKVAAPVVDTVTVEEPVAPVVDVGVTEEPIVETPVPVVDTETDVKVEAPKVNVKVSSYENKEYKKEKNK